MNKAVYIFFFLCFYSSAAFSQSRFAYEHAGDDALEKQDPVSAISYYNEALSYQLAPEIYFKLGKAYKLLNDYEVSLSWFTTCINKSNDNDLSLIASIESADLLKRLGRFKEAEQNLALQKNIRPADSTWFTETVKGIAYAEKLNIDSLRLQVDNAGTSVNSAYSDFAPVIISDSVLYFSSMRFPVKNKEKKINHTSYILKSSINDKTFTNPEPLPNIINPPKKNTANASISPDGRLMVFTRCEEDENYNLLCSLYESQFQKGLWQPAKIIADSVNVKGFTSTQPCITTNKAEGYLLFFSSDRPGGKGKNDIWISKRNGKGDYTTPQNAGDIINSAYDEITPFYNSLSDTLFFASDRSEGLGGYDIVCASYLNGKANGFYHPGPPLNSGFNDLYYTAGYSEKNLRMMVSNRPPSTKFNGNACCYDLFTINDLPPLLKKDSVAPIPLAGLSITDIPVDSINTLPVNSVLKKLNDLLPLRLYFDNDYPDPRTLKKSTLSNYNNLTNNYLLKISEYKDQYAKGNNALQKEDEIMSFFNDSINGNYQTLERFTSVIYELLTNGNLLKLRLQGCASPLADNSYNVTLSARRISSLRNYWLNWNNKMLTHYIASGKLLFIDDPAGENLAKQNVSDNFKDKAASVYSPAAARERRIEVTEISLQKQ